MNQTNVLPAIFGNLLPRLPVLLAFAVGAALALARWRHHPNVSLLVLLGCGVGFVSVLVIPSLHMWFAMNGAPISSKATILLALSYVGSALQTLVYGLFLFAAFVGRSALASVSTVR